MNHLLSVRCNWLAFAIGGAGVAAQLALMFVLGHADPTRAQVRCADRCAEVAPAGNGPTVLIRSMEVTL